MNTIFKGIAVGFLAFGMISCGNGEQGSESGEATKQVEEVRYYSGKVGKLNIIMQFNFSGDNILYGQYYYLSKCEPIQLVEMRNDKDRFIFSEMVEGGNKTGTISVRLKNGKEELEGEWTNPSGNKRLPLGVKEFVSRADKLTYKQEQHYFVKKEDEEIKTWKIFLLDSAGKNAGEFLLHETLFGNNWEEWEGERKEAEEKEEIYTGLHSFTDEILNEKYDLLSVYSEIIEGYRYFQVEEYEVYDLQQKKYLIWEDYLKEDVMDEFIKMGNRKLDELIDSQLPTQEEIEWGMQDNNADYLGTVKEYMEYDRGEFKAGNASYFMVDDDTLTYIWDFSSYGAMGLFGPEEKMYFTAKEIAPFLRPDGPLNYMLVDFFKNSK